MEAATRENEWISGVSARLKRQWPTIEPEPLDEMARVLWGYQALRALDPDRAADEWLAPVNPPAGGDL